jgi:DNA-binding XRE family transcriptional regulator
VKNIKLKVTLIEKGETQYRLAQVLKCDPAVVSRIFNGWINPSGEVKRKIANFLGKPVAELFQESTIISKYDQQRNQHESGQG